MDNDLDIFRRREERKKKKKKVKPEPQAVFLAKDKKNVNRYVVQTEKG
jgi:hypothetical protein